MIAERLGKTVGQLDREMTGPELLQWRVLLEVEADEQRERELEREATRKVKEH